MTRLELLLSFALAAVLVLGLLWRWRQRVAHARTMAQLKRTREEAEKALAALDPEKRARLSDGQ